MIFKQLNEKMRAMDRSLLEKIAADIEMLDDDQGKLIYKYLLLNVRGETRISGHWIKSLVPYQLCYEAQKVIGWHVQFRVSSPFDLMCFVLRAITFM